MLNNMVENAKKNTIIYAGYGYGVKTIDITEKVKQMYKEETRSFKASNSIAGDPWVGKVKALYIIWTENGVVKSAVTLEKDNTGILLPDNLTI